MGNPPKEKPTVVPIVTKTATDGEINIAINIGTWLANVKEAGSKTILSGENIGITIPIAHKSAVNTNFFELTLWFILIPPNEMIYVFTHVNILIWDYMVSQCFYGI